MTMDEIIIQVQLSRDKLAFKTGVNPNALIMSKPLIAQVRTEILVKNLITSSGGNWDISNVTDGIKSLQIMGMCVIPTDYPDVIRAAMIEMEE